MQIIGKPSAGGQTDQAGCTENDGCNQSGPADRNTVITNEHSWEERAHRVGREIDGRPGSNDPPYGWDRENSAHRAIDPGGWIDGVGFLRAANGLGGKQHHGCHDEPRDRRKIERYAPSIVLCQHADDAEGQQQAKRQTEHEYAERPRALFRWEEISDQRVCRRRTTRLANANQQTNPEERHEAPGETGGRRQQAPCRQACREDAGAAESIGEISKRHAGDRIDQREGCTQKTKCCVVKTEFLADGFQHHGWNGAVEKIHEID